MNTLTPYLTTLSNAPLLVGCYISFLQDDFKTFWCLIGTLFGSASSHLLENELSHHPTDFLIQTYRVLNGIDIVGACCSFLRISSLFWNKFGSYSYRRLFGIFSLGAGALVCALIDYYVKYLHQSRFTNRFVFNKVEYIIAHSFWHLYIQTAIILVLMP